jgi:uncharacterized protein (TIGR02246 family)
MTIRPLSFASCLLILALSTPAAAGQAPSTPDQRALASLVESWANARSANDAEAMRPLFAERVDRVNLPTGEVESTTRDELIAYFAKGFSGSAKGTHAKSITIRPVLLSATAGLVDHTYTMYNPDGSAIGVGHTTFVAVKDAGAWKIVAVRYASAWPQARVSSDAPSPR